MPQSFTSPIGRGSRRLALMTALTLTPLIIAGCQKKPGGQVVAVVNSEEITQQELRAEADAAGVPPGADPQKYTPAILNRVIERNLLAQYARDQSLDRGPDYVARRRQLEQTLLASLALRKIATAQPAPTQAEIQAYVQDHPATFSHRERLTLDQIRFPTPPDAGQIKALEKLGSIDAIEAKLRADHVQLGRRVGALDTGSLDPGVALQIDRLKDGELFDLSTNGVTFINAITARVGAVAPADTWPRTAVAALTSDRARKAVSDAMKKMRTDAKITYDPAYKPKDAH